MENYLTVREIFESVASSNIEDGYKVCIDGWIKKNRDFGNVGFIDFSFLKTGRKNITDIL